MIFLRLGCGDTALGVSNPTNQSAEGAFFTSPKCNLGFRNQR